MITIGKTDYQTPYINMFPPLAEEEVETLKSDITERGIIVPIVIDEERNVIDGHNRLRIAAELELSDIPFDIRVGLSEQEKKGLAQDLNLHRRHLDKEKRQEIAVRLRRNGMSYRAIGEKLGTSKDTAQRLIDSTVSHETVELPDKITGKDGKTRPATKPKTSVFTRSQKEANKAIKTLEQVTDLPNMTMTMQDVQREAKKAKASNTNNGNGHVEAGQFKVDGCNVIIGDAKKLDLSQFEKYGAIIADPPWPYRVTIKQGTTEGQYETMTDEDLRKIPVEQLAMPNCVLFMWGTWPKLPEAIKLIEAWGFGYITGFPWIKTTTNGNIDYGVGYWVRGVSEYILIAKRGNVSVEPLRMAGFLGLMGPNLKHSRKPDSVHQLAEKLKGPYLELFARRPRHGWTVFGNDMNLFQKTLA